MPARTDRGITLFETVAALTIVSMTAVGALAAVASELRTTERARGAGAGGGPGPVDHEVPVIRSRDGMTLLELVIALVITGLMAAVGTAAFGSIIDHQKRVEQASVTTTRAGAVGAR